MEVKDFKRLMSESIKDTEMVIQYARTNLRYTEGYWNGLSYALQLIDQDADDEDPEEDEEE